LKTFNLANINISFIFVKLDQKGARNNRKNLDWCFTPLKPSSEENAFALACRRRKQILRWRAAGVTAMTL
jgi:hypothetical protein